MNQEGLRFLERELRIEFPPEVGDVLLRFNNGSKESFGFRAMSIEEVLDIRRIFAAAEYASEVPDFLVPLWTDDESNFAAVCVDRNLRGKVCFIDHDGSFDLAPLFRNTSNFVKSLEHIENGAWWNSVLDYPQEGTEILRVSSPADLADDWRTVQKLYGALNSQTLDPRSRMFYQCSIVSITPTEHAQAIIDFIDHSELRLAGKACLMVGFHRLFSATSKLVEVATTRPALLGYTIDGLGLMRESDSLASLLKLREKYPKHKVAFARALKNHGLDIRQENGIWMFYCPKMKEWIPV
jgi:hypothetical protein